MRPWLALAFVAACAPSRIERASRAGFPAREIPGPGSPRARLGWVTWPDPDALIYCNRRVDDAGNLVGVLGPCSRLEAGEPQPRHIGAATNLGRADSSPTTAGPWDRCSIELEDARQVPSPLPARAWLLSPTGKTVIAEWRPDAGLAGDAFAIELSFAPEGKWMAVERLAVGLGGGERTIEVAGVELRAIPACR